MSLAAGLDLVVELDGFYLRPWRGFEVCHDVCALYFHHLPRLEVLGMSVAASVLPMPGPPLELIAGQQVEESRSLGLGAMPTMLFMLVMPVMLVVPAILASMGVAVLLLADPQMD